MSGHERDSQLSAMYDGELSAAECELLARRLARDEGLRRQWAGYSLIGAAIRGEPLAGQARGGGRDGFAERVAAAIARSDNPGAGSVSPTDDADAATAALATRGPRLPRWAVPLSGVGVAVGVAAAAILWLRFDAPGAASVAAVVPVPVRVASAETVLPAPEPLSAEGGASAPDSYTVPPPSNAPAVLMGGAAMANFVVAHSEVAAPLLRRNALSSLVADPEARYEEIDAPAPGQLPSPPPEASAER
jgi:negative regulator of sigma E activity